MPKIPSTRYAIVILSAFALGPGMSAAAETKKPPCRPGVISSGCDRNPGGTQLRKDVPVTPPRAAAPKPQAVPKGQDLLAKPQPKQAQPAVKPASPSSSISVRKPAPAATKPAAPAPTKIATPPAKDTKNPELDAASDFMKKMDKRR